MYIGFIFDFLYIYTGMLIYNCLSVTFKKFDAEVEFCQCGCNHHQHHLPKRQFFKICLLALSFR